METGSAVARRAGNRVLPVYTLQDVVFLLINRLLLRAKRLVRFRLWNLWKMRVERPVLTETMPPTMRW